MLMNCLMFGSIPVRTKAAAPSDQRYAKLFDNTDIYCIFLLIIFHDTKLINFCFDSSISYCLYEMKYDWDGNGLSIAIVFHLLLFIFSHLLLFFDSHCIPSIYSHCIL
jgi:hypothetical protein